MRQFLKKYVLLGLNKSEKSSNDKQATLALFG
jgi:hypothetical protein